MTRLDQKIAKYFLANYSSFKFDLLPYCWKPIIYQDVMSKTVLVETSLVSECIFKTVYFCESCTK